jgi:hypothetical protein
MPAHLRRSWLLLQWITSEKSSSRVFNNGDELGVWKELSPKWQVLGNSIVLRLRRQDRELGFMISSVRLSNAGATINRTGRRGSLPGTIEVIWRDAAPDSSFPVFEEIRNWIRFQLPGSAVLYAAKRPDLANSLSGSFLRVLFRYRGRDCLLVAADPSVSPEESHLLLTHALLWMVYLKKQRRVAAVHRIYLLVPSDRSVVLRHRANFVNRTAAKVEVWEYEGRGESWRARRAGPFPKPIEGQDFRWPLVGACKLSPSLTRVLDLAPELVRRYPCFNDYDSLRLWGLEFARALGPERDRLEYGVGPERIELTEDRFEELCSLVREIVYYRRADSPDPQHLYYRLQAERWLESLILENVAQLFPELVPEAVYSQIPVYLGQTAGRVDILGADRRGTLVVMELKVAPDPNLPVQCLDYWARVIAHNQNGDFERRGYFPGVRLNRRRPTIYLVSPVFSFHDSTERMMSYLDPGLEMWKIGINEDWRCGVKILRRSRFRCGDLL